jgi:hypothetical protein
MWSQLACSLCKAIGWRERLSDSATIRVKPNGDIIVSGIDRDKLSPTDEERAKIKKDLETAKMPRSIAAADLSALTAHLDPGSSMLW